MFVKKAILQHHEDYNGEGYPMGLKGRNINVLARVLREVDVFVAHDIPSSLQVGLLSLRRQGSCRDAGWGRASRTINGGTSGRGMRDASMR